MSKFQPTPRTLKLLDTLTPHAKSVILEALNVAYRIGHNMQVHSAYRSPAEQDAVYAMGRTKPGKIVTNARGTPVAQSSHSYKIAVDCHFDDDQNGVAEWESSKYQKVWDACKEMGLDKKGLWWSGLWEGKFKETAHWEVTFGKSWRDLAAGFDPSKHGQTPATTRVVPKPAPKTSSTPVAAAPKPTPEAVQAALEALNETQCKVEKPTKTSTKANKK